MGFTIPGLLPATHDAPKQVAQIPRNHGEYSEAPTYENVISQFSTLRMGKNDDMLKLDPNGGPEKVRRAMYGPKQHRGTQKRSDAPSGNRGATSRAGAVVWLLVLLLIASAFFRHAG